MFSWLNFEELLIHNPIELINPSKDTISVAMNQKQYIEFFSNKYTYNGLYYDEGMDFCLFYYADPLQSYKEGDVYAQGYIDVEMKIYRVKWLCNVSISRASGLLQTTDGTQGVPQEGGKYTHTAWAYSVDGTDRFTTIYPNLNLIEDGKFAKPISSKWRADGTTISKDDITGYFKVKFNGTGSLNRTYYTAGISPIPIGQKYSVYIKAYSLESSLNIKIGSVNTSQAVTVTNNSNIPKTYKVEGLVRGNSDTLSIFGGSKTTRGTLLISEIKVEPGSVVTPYMPSASEVTTADWPKYIGHYTDFTQADSTNPSDYTWSLIRDDKWNVSKTEMVVNTKAKTITTVLNGALAKCTKDKNITGWQNLPANGNYNYRQPQYSLDIGVDDFIISGYGLRGLKNG